MFVEPPQRIDDRRLADPADPKSAGRAERATRMHRVIADYKFSILADCMRAAECFRAGNTGELFDPRHANYSHCLERLAHVYNRKLTTLPYGVLGAMSAGDIKCAPVPAVLPETSVLAYVIAYIRATGAHDPSRAATTPLTADLVISLGYVATVLASPEIEALVPRDIVTIVR
jgi:hypothetical protein